MPSIVMFQQVSSAQCLTAFQQKYLNCFFRKCYVFYQLSNNFTEKDNGVAQANTKSWKTVALFQLFFTSGFVKYV